MNKVKQLKVDCVSETGNRLVNRDPTTKRKTI